MIKLNKNTINISEQTKEKGNESVGICSVSSKRIKTISVILIPKNYVGKKENSIYRHQR